MTSILAGICKNYRNNFKRHYIRSKRLYLNLLLHFWNVNEISSMFKKKHEYPSLIISEVIDAEKRGYLNV